MFNEILESTITILKMSCGRLFMKQPSCWVSHLCFLWYLAASLAFTVPYSKQVFLPKACLNKIIAAVINFIRSVPFIILVVFTLPFTFFLVGTKIGPVAASVPLSITATVFLARLIEISLKEVDAGVIEAALATGAKTSLIIRKVLLVEAAPGIARGITVTFISLIGFSAMAGMVGGGGIGNLAVQYGYYRYETGIMIFTIVVLVFIVQLAQYIGDYVAKKLTH